MKVAKYQLNRMVKDAGGGKNAKNKGQVFDAEPFH